MKRQPTIEQLCAEHHNEDAHAEHVTALALALFDAVRRRLALAHTDRRVLVAACRLHDVGYFRDPPRHAAAGAGIILENGIAGFSTSQCRDIAAAILLHQKKYEKRLDNPLVRCLPRQGRAFRLAAILRVADGLDHGHIQNVSIVSVRLVRRSFQVTLRGESVPPNAPAAEAKADLWREVMPCGLSLDGRARRPSPARLADAGGRDLSILETARQILCVQYRIIADNRRGAAAARSPVPLHDIRVAIRRLCACLRLFHAHVDGTSAARLGERFSRLNSVLGPIRDTDVWMADLRGETLASSLRHDKAWPAHIAFHKAARKRTVRKLRRLLRSRRFHALMEKGEYFLRIELPDLMRQRPPLPIEPFAALERRQLLENMAAHVDVGPETPGDELHALRKLARRGRYYAEFFAPVLGPATAELAVRFKEIADPLGDIHDTDVALDRMRKAPVPPPPKLRRMLLRRRESVWAAFAAAWKAIRRPEYREKGVHGLRRISRARPRPGAAMPRAIVD